MCNTLGQLMEKNLQQVWSERVRWDAAENSDGSQHRKTVR
jgi:hypothetical protein